MSKPIKETLNRSELFEALCEEPEVINGWQCVNVEHDTSWRHGSYDTAVFKRLSDNTFWSAVYTVSGDGEMHELRDVGYGGETVECIQVYPQEVTAIVYKAVKEDE